MRSSFSETLLHPADLNIFSGHLERMKTTRDGQLVEVEHRIEHANGEWRWFLSRDLVFTRTPEGAPRLLMGTAEDVTLRKQVSEALLRAQNELDRRVQERTAELARTNASLHEQIHEYEQAERVARAQTTVLAQSLQSLTANVTLEAFLQHVLIAITEQLHALVLTTYDGDEDIYRALHAGAQAYLIKDTPRDELLACIRSVHHGEQSLSQTVVSKLRERQPRADLTPREFQVLQLLSEGKSNREVGAALSIAEGTVKLHVNNLLAKLEAGNRAEAVTIALKRGILHVDYSGFRLHEERV